MNKTVTSRSEDEAVSCAVCETAEEEARHSRDAGDIGECADAPTGNLFEERLRQQADHVLDGGEDLEVLLADYPPEQPGLCLTVLVETAAARCWDMQRAEADQAAASRYADRIKDVLNEQIALETHSIRSMIESAALKKFLDHDLADFGMVLESGAVYEKAGTAKRPKRKLICNFIPKSVRTGEKHYTEGPARPWHIAEVVTAGGASESWELSGELSDPNIWKAGSKGRAIIPAKSGFATLLHLMVDRKGIQQFDPGLRQVLFVGSVPVGNGEVALSDGISFPSGAEECPYHGFTLPREGNRDVFYRIAEMRDDKAVEALMVYLLGAPLKAAFKTYPHGFWVGNKEEGKTTVINEISRLTGLKSYGAAEQLRTPYRRKKALANTNLPVLFDEGGRPREPDLRDFYNIMNEAYGVSCSTHGSSSTVYALSAPAVLLGQDFYPDDSALLSKSVICSFSDGNKNPDALARVRELDDPFPLGEWVSFGCQYANANNVLRATHEKADYIRNQLAERLSSAGAESDRTIQNYAIMLVVADILREWGLRVEIEDYVIETAASHLQRLSETGGNLAECFLVELVTAFAHPGRNRRILHEITDEGLYVNMPSAFECIGRGYEIRSAEGMTKHLSSGGYAITGLRRRINGTQVRVVLIPHEAIDGLGISCRPQSAG